MRATRRALIFLSFFAKIWTMKEDENSVHILQKFAEGSGSCRVCANARDHHRYRMGIYSQTGVADSIKKVFGNASSLMETAKKNTGTFDMEAVLKRLDEIQKGYLGNGYNIDYKRGVFSSLWIKTDDAADDKVKSLASELGATMWTYYNGLNTGSNKLGPDGGGLYWTTEKILTQQN